MGSQTDIDAKKTEDAVGVGTCYYYSTSNVLYICFTLNAVCLQAVSDKLNILIF